MKLKNSINVNTVSVGTTPLLPISQALLGQSSNVWTDGFPSLPGDVTRWKFGDLTNEGMSAMTNPQVADTFGKGRFLEFKNLAWAGMSGVGGCVQDFNKFRNNSTVDKVRIDEQSSDSIKATVLATGVQNAIYIPKAAYQFNKSYSLKITSEGYNEDKQLSLYLYAVPSSTATSVRVQLNPNGVTEIPAVEEDDFLGAYVEAWGKAGSFTIEQLPLYPGAIVFDGVDDYGVCENFPILTKEKGFTIVAVRQTISRSENASGIASKKDRTENGAFLFEGMNLAKTWISSSFGGDFSGLEKSPFSYMTSTSYNGNIINPGNRPDENNLLVVGRHYTDINLYYANAAIWELVFLDHDATPEELAEIESYFISNYSFLFN